MATLRRDYEEEVQGFKGALSAILSGEQKNAHTKLELEVFAAEVEVLKSGLDTVVNAMDLKLKEPSRKVEVPPLADLCNSVFHRLEQANELISAHNTTVSSIKSEQRSLTRAVWRHLSEKSESLRDSHAKTVIGFQKRLAQAIALYDETVRKGTALSVELLELTKGIAGVEASVVEINTILKSFGFNSFRVAVSKEKRGCYRIERPDGSPVGDTLSEGETTFLTFLYFYRLMVGGRNESTVNEKRVIVVDDPISSLDSNVLFVVSSLLRAHIEDIRNNRGNIVQLFILTHNAYFQKQLAIEKGRDIPLKNTAYWVLRKRGRWTEVKPYGMVNPISSTYQLLWAELRDNDKVSTSIVQNAMRRILEYYFTILGMGGNLSKLPDTFKDSPQDLILCDSLIRWAHGGSHDITDEITVSDSDDAKERYMQVFRKIFEANSQLGHYNMMMGITESAIIQQTV
jgi:wobble nucleotide-excising tRNase